MPLPAISGHLQVGRASPATVPLGNQAQPDDDDDSDRVDVLYDLDSADFTCHSSAQRAASAVVSSARFLALYSSDATSAAGRARMLDGSVPRGPFSFWRRVPAEAVPEGTSDPSSFFSFAADPHAFSAALAVDLLLQPPVPGVAGGTVACRRCRCSIDRRDRHFVPCRVGIRLNATCHDPCVRALIPILDAIFGAARVLAERGGTRGRAALDAWIWRATRVCATARTL